MWDNYTRLFRLANTLLWVAGFLVLLAGANWLINSSFFPVRYIDVQGHLKKVTQEQLRYIAENELRGTFFTLDIDQIRQSFEKLPWVKAVHLHRRWPDKLVVDIVEHQAIARWDNNGLVDTTGEWFDAATNDHLPILVGPARSEKIMVAILPNLIESIRPLGLEISRMELTQRGAWRIVLSNNIFLELGCCDTNLLKKRVALFAKHWPDILNKNTSVRYVDMRYLDGFAINALSQ